MENSLAETKITHVYSREAAIANGVLFPLGPFGVQNVLITKSFLCDLTKTELAMALLGALHRAQNGRGADLFWFRIGDHRILVDYTDSTIVILLQEDC